jgi:hypothetical protein
MAMNQPVRASNHAATPKAKPDARPMRMALGAGGIAAFSALAAAIVLPPQPAQPAQVVIITTPQPQPQVTDPGPSATPLQVVRPIQYVQLLPGQTAPPGATVIGASAPTPVTMVVTVPAPAPKAAPPAPPKVKVAAPTPIIIKTTQSGKVIP